MLQFFILHYNFESIGLRYFNVFGRRQDPAGSYAAVIPKWVDAFIGGETVVINGDGSTSRDFCYIDNVIQANILAATTDNQLALNEVFNIAVGDRTSLLELTELIKNSLPVNSSSEILFHDLNACLSTPKPIFLKQKNCLDTIQYLT